MRTGGPPVYRRALLRGVSPALAAAYGADVERAREQHARYADALGSVGVAIVALPEDADLADCCFVEDGAVVDRDRALLTRMGCRQRRPESVALHRVLEDLGFEVCVMELPATLDGGDVLRLGDRVFVGSSSRTNDEGARVLQEFLGRPCTRVPVRDCLHLKTACTQIGDEAVALNPAWVDRAVFEEFDVTEATDPNALWVNGTCFVTDAALPGLTLDISELQKAQGGLTCLSLLLR